MKHYDVHQGIIVPFVEAVKSGNRHGMMRLLDENGRFQIQNESLEEVEVDAITWVNWMLYKIGESNIITVDFDRCSKCLAGKPVVIFNCGFFPLSLPKNRMYSRQAGLAFEVLDDKIFHIRFCYNLIIRDLQCTEYIDDYAGFETPGFSFLFWSLDAGEKEMANGFLVRKDDFDFVDRRRDEDK